MTNEHELNRNALIEARKKTMFPHNLAPATVTYSTYGHLLILGSEDMIRLAAEQLENMASVTLLVTEAISNHSEAHLNNALAAAVELPLYKTKLHSIKGFLGQFQVAIEQDDQIEDFAKIAQNRVHFDLILNLGKESQFAAELAPTGYFHVAPNSDQLSTVITELPNYIGEFDKPRYFQINNDICAHSSRGQTGCTRCLDICPADAIHSEKSIININPHLCHGAGGCATACPTGAINYSLPQPAQMHSYLQKLLHAYKEYGGTHPVIIFHDHEQGHEIVDKLQDQLPNNFITVQLEELAAAGQETWLTCLASGAEQVLLLETMAIPDGIKALLKNEIKLGQTLLSGMQYDASQLQIITENQLITIPQQTQYKSITPIELISTHNKRDTLFTALDHLISENKLPDDSYLALPAGSPFGQIAVNNTSCTLCMSCVAVCPTQSLTDGGGKPALNFEEQNCVQCGLCEGACPEKAITLIPRLSFSQQRNVPFEIHSEDPFECITCAKPFAPKSTINKMLETLKEHPYFQGAAINRLKMCEDCRVNDIFTDLSANPEKQLEL